jgi:peroxiredoxin
VSTGPTKSGDEAPTSRRARRIELAILGGLTMLLLFLLGQQLYARRGLFGLASQAMAGVTPPDFALQTPGGESLTLGQLRGQVVLVNFWATWCPPCREEIPDLVALQERFGATQHLTVLGIDRSEDAGLVAAFVKQHGINYPVVIDPDGRVTEGSFGVRSLPTTLIIDREGKVRDLWTGGRSQYEVLERLRRIW